LLEFLKTHKLHEIGEASLALLGVNERKHGVTFQEGAVVFGDSLAVTFADPDHSTDEYRYITFGLSRFNRLLVVSHTDRGDRVRIISARLVTRQERKIYEKG
jgi:uncharacterized DUF497 family protein